MIGMQSVLRDERVVSPPRRGADVTPIAPEPARHDAAPPLPDHRRLAENGIFAFADGDPRSRAFTMLRSQVLTGFHRGGGRVLAVTSTQPANGKTYVTANLAAALSRIHPTVLVDLDLRRPSIAARYAIAPVAGIDDHLAGDAPADLASVTLPGTDLTIFAAREPRARSAELLASPALAALFARIRALPGDPICIVDTPPVLLVDDIMLIARAADGVLMIVEEGRTRARDLADALRLIAPTPVIGSVLNKSLAGSTPRRSYGYYDDRP